jgi:hypothetical protein
MIQTEVPNLHEALFDWCGSWVVTIAAGYHVKHKVAYQVNID